MYDRASRILTRPTDGTTPDVGPGTYYNPFVSKSRAESYAPFQSMSVRESFLTIGEGVAAAPGPGHYSPSIGNGAKGGCSLHNKSNRFESPHSFTPGPGAYPISSEWPQKVRSSSYRDTNRPNHVKYKRQTIAPSIPSSGFNNGYEEDNGTLKPQVVPASDYTLGPAYYNPPLVETTALQNYKGVHFGTLSSKRSVFKGRGGPGPSDYSPGVLGSRRQVLTSSFIPTSIPRYHELVEKEETLKCVPGPGQYELKSQFEGREESRDPEPEKAPFGSCLQRFIDQKHISPACTTYQDPRTALSSVHRLQGMKRTPFGQTSGRFKTDRDALLLPGPGMYNDNYTTGMASQIMRKIMLTGFSQCPFGTTSSRRVPFTKKDESLMPGPAHYQDDENKNLKSNDRLSCAFASTTSRLYSAPAIDRPSPGSYEVSKAFTTTQGKTDTSAIKTGFLSTLERFAPPRDIAIEEPDVFNPGPGEYDNADQKNCKGGVISSDKPRLKTLKKTTPGPGAYDLPKSQMDTVLCGTFNITLVNPLKKEKNTNLVKHKEISTVLIGV